VNNHASVVRGVFDACASVVRSNADVAFFLLPLTVVEVLKSGEEHMDFIKEEVFNYLYYCRIKSLVFRLNLR